METNVTDWIVVQCVLTDEERIIVSIMTILITTTGLIGNASVILSISLSKKLHTVCNTFILNLCLADLLTCSTGPLMAITYLQSVDELILPDIVCCSIGFLTISCIGCSVYSLASIAVNRLLHITSHNHLYRLVYTPFKITLIIAFTWLVPIFMACLPPVFGMGRLGYDRRFSTCTWDPTHPLAAIYSMMLSAVVYPISFIIIAISYSVIFCKVRQHSRVIRAVDINVSVTESSGRDQSTNQVLAASGNLQQNVSKRQVKVTRNMFLVVVCFLVCLTPYGACLMAPNSDEFIVYAGQILLANSFVNPIIYGTKHPDFKVVMRCVFRCRLRDVPEKTAFCKWLMCRWD